MSDGIESDFAGYQRDEAGRFQPGNPGRKPGARNRATLAVEAMLDGEAERLTRVAIDRAAEGDMVAMRLVMDRVVAPRRDRPVSFRMPPIKTIADISLASAAIVEAVAEGHITPDEASSISRLLEAHAKILETSELAERLARLEEKAGG
jgi:hypothetical protein